MEGDAVAQAEGVDQPVLRDIPRVRKRWADGAIGRVSGESLVNVCVDDFIDRRRRAAGGIQIWRLERHYDRDRCIRGIRGSEDCDDRESRGQRR